ncbi:MAG: winged helix-turn-helix domain-containing protein [Tannerella sp.]|jgi:hypothetical protein|nr:winged helix-turn-helix domain-containing protein [Tannerella sp.]
MIELFGTNAGLVWNALSKSGRLSMKDLKKETKIRAEKEIYAALGWLAREGKIDSAEKDGEIHIWLV